MEGSTPTKEVTGAQYDDELFEDDVKEEDLSYYCSSFQGKRGHKLSEGGQPKPDTTNMTTAESDMALAEWRIIQKAHTDKKQRLLRMESEIKTSAIDQTYTGVLNDQLRTMTDVESSPLMLDHTFPTKEVLLLRITEEANLSGCHVSSKRSDDYRVQVVGSSDSSFKMNAVYSSTYG